MWYTIVFIAGVVLLAISLFLLSNRIRFLKNGSIATGTVIAMEEGRDSDGDRTNKPIFRFTTHANQEITFTYDVSTNPPAWEVGDTNRVAYDTNDPENAKLLTYFGSFGLIIILTSISLVLLVIGGGYYLADNFFKTL